MEVSRLSYASDEIADAESDVSFMVKQTITQGCNDGGVLAFRFPGDPDRFTDLNKTLLRVTVSVTLPNGNYPDFAAANYQSVWLDPEGIHSLFSSVEVKFNDDTVSTMTMYPFTSALVRSLGSTQEFRSSVWDELDGSHEHTELRSSYLNSAITLEEEAWALQIRRDKELTGRIYSDVLTSSRQYLPPGVTLTINLRRAPDHFSLVTDRVANDYRLRISSASVYIKRLQVRPSLLPRALESVRESKCLTFNRLECRMLAVPQGSSVFRWQNCLNSAPIPNRLYVAFVAQESIYGTITRISTYFESLNLYTLNFKLNGRDILVEPIKVTISKNVLDGRLNDDESDARQGYLTLLQVLNHISDQSDTVKMSLVRYMRGYFFYAVELGKCGQKIGGSGSLDIEATFNAALTDLPACMLVFTEKTASAQISM